MRLAVNRLDMKFDLNCMSMRPRTCLISVTSDCPLT